MEVNTLYDYGDARKHVILNDDKMKNDTIMNVMLLTI